MIYSLFLLGGDCLDRVEIGSEIAEQTHAFVITRANELVVQMHTLHQRLSGRLIGFYAILNSIEPIRPTKEKTVWIDRKRQ